MERVISIARQQLGRKEEPPKSNKTLYGELYRLNGQPWCVIFLWWCFVTAGLQTIFYGGQRTASCSQLLSWAESVGQTVQPQEARPGDVLFFNFDTGRSPEHCGLCVERTGTIFQSIEGNTPLPEDEENDGVAQKSRRLSQIVGVWRPKYESTTDYDGRWSYAAICEAIQDGVLSGYPDGSFKPDRPVTREELAQFYVNLKKMLGR